MIAIQTITEVIETHSNIADMASAIGISILDLKQIMCAAMNHTYPDGIAEAPLLPIVDYADDGYEDEPISKLNEFDHIIKQSNIPFSDEQIAFMDMAVNKRRNIALLAPAGYGKSETLITTIKLFETCVKQESAKYFQDGFDLYPQDARELAEKPVVYLCASTGKAASLLHARTIYSLLGIGIGRGTPEQWYKRISTTRYLKNTFNLLRSIKCLIVDEISMIGATILDKISRYLQLANQNEIPFGGVQIIVVGDFAQLPPINDRFAFLANSYKDANIMQMPLTKCFRQSDPVFQNILNELRFGSLSDEAFATLRNQLSIDSEYAAGIKPTLLCSTNAEVDMINNREIQQLCDDTKQKLKTYKVILKNSVNRKKAEACRKADGTIDDIELAIGAQVMVTFNISREIINGTQGVITMMEDKGVTIKMQNEKIVTIPYIGFKDPDDEDIYTAKDLFQYMPLRVSYAMSIHKSQGTTLQLLEIDCKRIFVAGQLYVGISRVRDMRGLIVKNLSHKAVMCHPTVMDFYKA